MTEQIHILVPFRYAELGGGQLFFLKLADAMDKAAVRFSCWLFEQGPLTQELAERDIPVRTFSGSALRTPWGLWRLSRELRSENPDVIYLHASRVLAWVARFVGIPCVERINMSRTPEAGGWSRYPRVDRFFTCLNTKVVAVSAAIREQLLSRGTPGEKIEVIRNFVDAERFHQPALRAPTRQELGIPEHAVVVLNVGRMVEQKGQADFLQLAAQFLEDDRLYFVLAGDGPLRERLSAQAERLGLSSTGRFHLLPFQRDVERLYAASDILLHSAHWEPLANVLLEAQAAGLAIVATDVDGTREVVGGRMAP